ncbi:siderophore-interacting protein [Streptomyces sp. NPDC095613]|uniref:siderophore-interacting protein n=1 Tax=Streptomyces sp. NPDC095613 TaxID=3155540 RepID=UPI003323563C
MRNDAPFQFFSVEVLRTERVTPAMARITLGGEDMARMATAGRDQRVKLFFPHPGQDAPVMPDSDRTDWYDAYRELDPAVRGIMRTFTARELRRDPDELVIDFALHGPSAPRGPSEPHGPDEGGGGLGSDRGGTALAGAPPRGEDAAHVPTAAADAASGPASRWARSARPGDRISVLAPVYEENAGYDFRPPDGTDWILLAADACALPAVAGILETLPSGVPARVWVEVPDRADRQDLPTKADAEITWLTPHAHPSPATAAAISAAALPDGTPYAWVAGESATVKAVRRHLVRDRGFDRGRVKFSGYWRRGASEDNLTAVGDDA